MGIFCNLFNMLTYRETFTNLDAFSADADQDQTAGPLLTLPALTIRSGYQCP